MMSFACVFVSVRKSGGVCLCFLDRAMMYACCFSVHGSSLFRLAFGRYVTDDSCIVWKSLGSCALPLAVRTSSALASPDLMPKPMYPKALPSALVAPFICSESFVNGVRPGHTSQQ